MPSERRERVNSERSTGAWWQSGGLGRTKQNKTVKGPVKAVVKAQNGGDSEERRY